MAGRLEGKVALVTGAARGIGRATAEAFAREGARVVLSDVREAEGRAAAGAIGGAAEFARLDVREEGDWEAAVGGIVARHGRLDVLVNNAGVTGFEGGAAPHDPENASLEDWRAVHRVNLDGVFLGCRAAIRAMRPAGTGSIVNVSSRSGMVGIPGASAYASSKAAVRNHTKSVALYCAEQGLAIRCNSVHPAAVLTPLWEPVLGDPGPEREARMRAFVRDVPLGRWGGAEEVAAMIVYLASDESAYVTGAELTIDGGLLAGATARPDG